MKSNRKRIFFTPLNLMVIPGILYLLINNYIPMAGISIAFKRIDYSKGIFLSNWIGLENFKYLFATKDAFIITRNTILYNITFIILSTALGLIVGVFLSEIISNTAKRIYQTLILLPQLFSIIIIAYIAVAFLGNEAGFINKTLLGPGQAINFYGTPKYWPFILTMIYLWKGLGYNSIIYLSAIVSVDRNLYEAATVDGLGHFGQIFYVTIPSIRPTIITLVLIAVGRIFYSDFGLFYQVPMNSGVLYNATSTIDTYVYRSLLQLNNIAMASAASTYQALVGFIIIIAVNGIIQRIDRDNAMF
ncbi:MAG: ABC transporter permease subunit [Prevotella sp.]|nr:ABC transporter permease subunit [Prevotella sp.]